MTTATPSAAAAAAEQHPSTSTSIAPLPPPQPQQPSAASTALSAAPPSAFSFLSHGAILHDFRVGRARERSIVLRFNTPDQYARLNAPYFGETVGRIANRVSGARIDGLNGEGSSYTLARNNGPNSLHGGVRGWGKREFEQVGGEEGKETTLFRYVSPHMEEGYPGAVEVRVRYTPATVVEMEPGGSRAVEKSVLEVEFEAEMVGDPAEEEGVDETVVAMTNHTYFNLNLPASPTIANTRASLSTNLHLESDPATSIPTGAISAFPGIEPDTEFTLGPASPAIDSCFVHPSAAANPGSIPLDTRTQPLRPLARLRHPESGVCLQVLSTEPAFQFYTGEFVDVPAVPGGKGEGEAIPPRGPRAGFCVEPGRFVNAVNTPGWRGMVRLRRGEKYGARIVYRAWEQDEEGEGKGGKS